MLAALSFTFHAAADCFPAPSGIIGFWEADGNALDVVGGNNGVLKSNATATATGKVGSAFSFNGTNSFIQIADAPVLHPTNFTIEGWVNFTSLSSVVSGGASSGEQYIVFKQNTRSTSFDGFALEKVINSASHQVFQITVTSSGGTSAKTNSTTIIATNTWYHVAAVRGANFLQLYINGALEAQTSVSFAQDYGTQPLYFGSTGLANDGKFNGRLDEVSLYNTALSSSDIASIFAAGATGKCRPPTNDAFANATVLTGASNTFVANNVNATTQPSETALPTSDPTGGASAWWTFTPPDNGTITVSIQTNFAFPFLLAVYTNSSVSNLTLIGSNVRNIGQGFLEQEMTVMSCDVKKNVPYYLSFDTVSGSSDTGAALLTFQYTQAPANDAFASRISLGSATSAVSGSNIAASFESGEPAHAGTQPARSVWWTWTPAASGPVILSTYGSAFDTVLDVYTNTTLGTLISVGSNDNCFTFTTTNGPAGDSSSRVFLNAIAGRPYQISVSGATNDSGSIALNFVTAAIDNILSVQRNVNSDGSVNFSANLDITNLGTTATGPLRVQLLARAGYAYEQFVADDDPTFLPSLNVADETIGTISLPASGVLASHTATQLVVTGHCDAPYPTNVSGPTWGFGRVIIALLQQQVGGIWQPADGRLLLAGEWPLIGGFGGPGGGVVILNSGFGNHVFNPASLVVNIGPPLALRLGGAWRVSPTNFGSLGELRYYTNFTSNSLTLAVQSSAFSIDVQPVASLISPSNRSLTISPGTTVPLDLFYTVPQPRLTYNRTNGLAISIPQVGTSFAIESANGSQMLQGSWQTVTNITLPNTNFTTITNTKPASTATNLSYRARWLSQ